MLRSVRLYFSKLEDSVMSQNTYYIIADGAHTCRKIGAANDAKATSVAASRLRKRAQDKGKRQLGLLVRIAERSDTGFSLIPVVTFSAEPDGTLVGHSTSLAPHVDAFMREQARKDAEFGDMLVQR